MLDETQFRLAADRALTDLFNALGPASDSLGFDVDFNAGALTVEFDDPPAKFVVSPNSPVAQIWVSAHMKSFKLDYVESQSQFVLPETGQSLKTLMAAHIETQLGQPVEL
jgi:iron donor protein CyaY